MQYKTIVYKNYFATAQYKINFSISKAPLAQFKESTALCLQEILQSNFYEITPCILSFLALSILASAHCFFVMLLQV